MKIKKFISILSSLVLSVGCIGSTAVAEENQEWGADIFYIIVDELDDNGKHCQWYTTDNIAFRRNGVTVKMNGEDVTNVSDFGFDKGVTPPETYDGINFDYVVPVTIISRAETLNATLPVKIGKKGDVNLDHIVDVRDSSAIVRDTEYFSENKTSKLDDFGIYLGAPEKDSTAYGLSLTEAAVLANKLAKNALDRASGEKYEKKGESEYSLSISKAYGSPGEKVTVQVVVEADDSFESLDALIEWDDDTLKSAGAVSVNGTLCESYVEDGMISIVDYSSGDVKDGAIASIDFIIPEDAKPGSSLDVYFSSVETFAVSKDGETSADNKNVVNVLGATIGVTEPKTTTPVTTTVPETTETTTTSTTVQTSVTTESTTTTSTVVTTMLNDFTVPVITTSVTTETKPVTTTKITTPDKTTTTKPVTTAPVNTQLLTTTSAVKQTTVSKITTVAPSSTTTVTTTKSLEIILVKQGDANLDGVVDIRDAAYIAYKLAIGEGSMLHNVADYNLDGVKNIRDSAAIAKYLSTRHSY